MGVGVISLLELVAATWTTIAALAVVHLGHVLHERGRSPRTILSWLCMISLVFSTSHFLLALSTALSYWSGIDPVATLHEGHPFRELVEEAWDAGVLTALAGLLSYQWLRLRGRCYP